MRNDLSKSLVALDFLSSSEEERIDFLKDKGIVLGKKYAGELKNNYVTVKCYNNPIKDEPLKAKLSKNYGFTDKKNVIVTLNLIDNISEQDILSGDIFTCQLVGYEPIKDTKIQSGETYINQSDSQVLEKNINYDINTGCYYKMEYIPYKYRTSGVRASVESEYLYQDKYKSAFGKLFRDRIISGINAIVCQNNLSNRKIVLVAIPSSKANRKGAMIGTIDRMCQMDARYINGSEVIYRAYDVNTANQGNRLSKAEHIESLKLKTEEIDSNAVYIILDDIVTTGTQMSANTEVLAKYVDIKNIYRFALAKTRKQYAN